MMKKKSKAKQNLGCVQFFFFFFFLRWGVASVCTKKCYNSGLLYSGEKYNCINLLLSLSLSLSFIWLPVNLIGRENGGQK